ncbi:MAG: prolipoprotein diacylglyceryl transferase [Planctomycetota bacterium]|nr:prolipoprotein diacylglyceryl transferase [Planctomycetota bacterium]
MLPILFRIDLPWGGQLPVYSYGLMILVGFLSAYLLISKLARGTSVKMGHVFDAGFLAVVVGFIGAKISYFMHNADYFQFIMSDPIGNIAYLSGGLDFFGGLILGVPTVYFFLRFKGYRAWSVGDLIVPGLALAHAFGRIGCFLNGCCYGFACKSCGLQFSDESAVYYDQLESGLIPPSAVESLPVFPSQLLEASLLFILCGILAYLFSRRKFAGQVVGTYLVAYGVIRFCVQLTRADEAVEIFGPFKIWHLVAFGVFVSGAVLYTWLRRKSCEPDHFLRDGRQDTSEDTEQQAAPTEKDQSSQVQNG